LLGSTCCRRICQVAAVAGREEKGRTGLEVRGTTTELQLYFGANQIFQSARHVFGVQKKHLSRSFCETNPISENDRQYVLQVQPLRELCTQTEIQVFIILISDDLIKAYGPISVFSVFFQDFVT
jgi:ABC-type enterochelin transport system substrate-binding protein